MTETDGEKTDMTPEQEKALQRMANDLHRLNNSVMAMVDLGLSVELIRTWRYHEKGAWGDMLVPIVRDKK
ncbi:hypothetical protein [Eilatimonas milleporae]|uniref:Uncharacterized protein n=1 Tax=Eilatimonas milleporae TaxID=911205 RepID=A0A3M0BY71_9PROT|nr:hypothetical protein [Eilatimonas milleporae]RMB01387.1 hypothetical protein BXY39_3570 [Eilatimonas milleporae]